MDMNNKYGVLLGSDLKLFRKYFEELVRLQGIQVIYRAPKPDKHYTTYAEIDSNYYSPKLVGVIFDEYPEQTTLKKMGWASELQESPSIIHVAYDLDNIQQGALFIVPSAIDNSEGRLFRVVEMKTSMIYPASIACKIVPEYVNTFNTSSYDYKHTSLNLLSEEKDNVGL